MKEYVETLREIVDGKYCIIGYPVTWQLANDMDAEGYWDPEGEEAWDDVKE